MTVENITNDPLLTPAEVADQLRTHRQWVYDLLKSNELAYTRLASNKILIRQSEVDRYLAERTNPPAA